MSGVRQGDRDRSLSRRGPQERIPEPNVRFDDAAGDETVFEKDTRFDPGSTPDDGVPESCPCSQCRIADHAGVEVHPRGGELARTEGKNPGALVEDPRSGRKRSAARERFERRAEEIAGLAEVREGAVVLEPADFLPPFEDALPQVDERALARRDVGKEPRGEHTDAGEEKWFIPAPAALSPEARDAVPFGLKRRIPVGLPIGYDEKRGEPAALAVALEKSSVVGLDGGVRIDDEEISAREESGRVREAARRAQDPGLGEEDELWQFRRAVDQVLLDLMAEMMEIHAGFANAEPREMREVGSGERDVQIRKERLGDSFGDRTKTHSASGREQEGAGVDPACRPGGRDHGRHR